MLAGFIAAIFIFVMSIFAVQHDGHHQPIGKSFRSFITYFNDSSVGNFTFIGSKVRNFRDEIQELGSELLDFTNSSSNWYLPTHTSFADLTSDISIEHLLMRFGAGNYSLFAHHTLGDADINGGDTEPVEAIDSRTSASQLFASLYGAAPDSIKKSSAFAQKAHNHVMQERAYNSLKSSRLAKHLSVGSATSTNDVTRIHDSSIAPLQQNIAFVRKSPAKLQQQVPEGSKQLGGVDSSASHHRHPAAPMEPHDPERDHNVPLHLLDKALAKLNAASQNHLSSENAVDSKSGSDVLKGLRNIVFSNRTYGSKDEVATSSFAGPVSGSVQQILSIEGSRGMDVSDPRTVLVGMNCSTSFESTCKLYNYVRFWNRRFFPEDCYESPLRPAMKEKTPWDKQKYVVFEPDWGGWNNIRMAAETVMIFAHATGRTLVMPPTMKFYLLDKNKSPQDNESGFDKFFDLNKIRESITIISMEEFIENVAKAGLLKYPFPKDLTTQKRTKLYAYIEKAAYSRDWEPGRFFIGFNLSLSKNADQSPVFGTFEKNKATQPRYKEMVAHGRALVPYDQAMDAERVIYFYGRYDSNRMLTHFYTYLYWEDFHTEQIYKRFVRDRLHYHDDIFCAAGQVVALLHQDANEIDGKGVQTAAQSSYKTLGGNTNYNSTYFAFHIRRGDFQYKETRLSAETIWENTRHLLDTSVSTLIYIATDEKDVTFFKPFMQPPYTVKFLHDYEALLGWVSVPGQGGRSSSGSGGGAGGKGLNRNHLGMIEQVICANAHTFIGTPRSSFTGYITRMRGEFMLCTSINFVLLCTNILSVCSSLVFLEQATIETGATAVRTTPRPARCTAYRSSGL
jgi:hypothetical protein